MEDLNPFSGEPSIVVAGVSMEYQTHLSAPTGTRRGAGSTRRFAKRRHVVHALRGVDFVARTGRLTGVIGANGSGKSTLLRLIAGVERPTTGTVVATSQPTLLGVNAALQTALSGAANIKLGCLAMGMNPEEANDAFDSIVELSALGDAVYRPMNTYSSGMGARLRFAIGMAASPSILLIDEALATGDATFQDRSAQAMQQLLDRAGTVLLVNHAAKTIQELCTRAVWMHEGRIILDGPAEDVAERYRWWAWNVAKSKPEVAENLLHQVLSETRVERIEIVENSSPVVVQPRHSTGKRARASSTRRSSWVATSSKRVGQPSARYSFNQRIVITTPHKSR